MCDAHSKFRNRHFDFPPMPIIGLVFIIIKKSLGKIDGEMMTKFKSIINFKIFPNSLIYKMLLSSFFS